MDYTFDKEKIRKQCEEFFSMYNVTKGRIREMCERKKKHTRAVAQNSYLIAESLGLSSYDCDIAWVIGEIHDFARFGQAVVTKTFKDSEEYDHARMAVRLLFTHKMIEDIIPDYSGICTEDRLVMEKAVYNHSRRCLPDGLTERERVFCDIICEADRIDIFRTLCENDWETIYGCGRSTLFSSDISDRVLEFFDRQELVDRKSCLGPADFHLAHIALCFGLKTEAALKLAVKQGYLTSLLDETFSDAFVREKYERAAAQVRSYIAKAFRNC